LPGQQAQVIIAWNKGIKTNHWPKQREWPIQVFHY